MFSCCERHTNVYRLDNYYLRNIDIVIKPPYPIYLNVTYVIDLTKYIKMHKKTLSASIVHGLCFTSITIMCPTRKHILV